MRSTGYDESMTGAVGMMGLIGTTGMAGPDNGVDRPRHNGVNEYKSIRL